MADDKVKRKTGAKKRLTADELVHNNKFVLLLSLLLAFVIWFWVSMEKSPQVEATIASVPVKIDMQDSVPARLNPPLRIFGDSEYTVDIRVRGRKFIVSALKPEDFAVTAQTNLVDSAGKKSLQLRAVSNSPDQFEILGLSKNYIDVYFDSYKEEEMALQPVILPTNGKTAADGCMLGSVVFSRPAVILSGPSAEVNKVTGVAAETVLNAPLSETKTVTPEIKLIGADEGQLANVEVKYGDTKPTMTIPVLKKVELPTTVTLKNAPAAYLGGSAPVTVSPSVVRAAIPVEKAAQTSALSVGVIDFCELDAGQNVFKFSASEVTDFVLLDTSVGSFRVKVNMSGMSAKTFAVSLSDIAVTNQKEGFSTVPVSRLTNVRAVGPKGSIAKIKPDMFKAVIDLSDVEVRSGEQSVPVQLAIRGSDDCWVSGTYTVAVRSAPAMR